MQWLRRLGEAPPTSLRNSSKSGSRSPAAVTSVCMRPRSFSLTYFAARSRCWNSSAWKARRASFRRGAPPRAVYAPGGPMGDGISPRQRIRPGRARWTLFFRRASAPVPSCRLGRAHRAPRWTRLGRAHPPSATTVPELWAGLSCRSAHRHLPSRFPLPGALSSPALPRPATLRRCLSSSLKPGVYASTSELVEGCRSEVPPPPPPPCPPIEHALCQLNLSPFLVAVLPAGVAVRHLISPVRPPAPQKSRTKPTRWTPPGDPPPEWGARHPRRSNTASPHS